MNQLISTTTAITKSSLTKFIRELIKEGYRVYWKYDKRLICLVVEDDSSSTDLTFERDTCFMTLTLNNQSFANEILLNKVCELINDNSGHIKYEEETLEYKVQINILNLEINYWLMELHERITLNEPAAIEHAKRKLTVYVNELNSIKEKVKTNEPIKTV